MSPHPLSPAQRAVLADALGLVRSQRERAAAVATDPAARWATPFALGYFVGAVDGLCQAHGAPFDGMALAVFGLVLDDTFGPARSDALRARALDLLDAGDAAFGRGRAWGGNEALGLGHGHVPSGLVHVARGDEGRMAFPPPGAG